MKPFRTSHRFLLIIALVFATLTALMCAAEYITASGQRMETEAELRRSQRSGSPISSELIDRQISRDRYHDWVRRLVTILSIATGGAIFVALIAIERSNPK